MLAPGAIDMADAIFISNVARGATEQAIKEAFEDIAEVKSVTLVKNKQTGQTKGYGFVCFYTKEDKYKALDMTTPPKFKDQVNGRWCSLRIQTADPKNVLFIGSLPKDLDEEELRLKLSEFGEREVVKFELSVTADRQSRGYGWATYSDHDTALHALKTLQHATWPEVSFTVAFAKLRTFDERLLAKVKILYVKNVAPEASQEEIKELFGSELVEDVVIPVDKESGAPAGHAFVHFKERSDASEAIHKMQNAMLRDRPISIEWSLPPEAKRTQQEEREGGAAPSPRGPGGRGGGRMGNGAGRGARRESRSGSDAGGNYPGPYGYGYSLEGTQQHWAGETFHEPWKEVGYEEEQYAPEGHPQFALHHGHGHRHPHPSQMGPHGYHNQRMSQQQYMGGRGRHGGQYEMYGDQMGEYGYEGHMGAYAHAQNMGYGGRGRGRGSNPRRRPQPLQQPSPGVQALEAAMAIGMAIGQLGQSGASSPPPSTPPSHHSPPGSPMHPQSHGHSHHMHPGHAHQHPGHPPMSPTHPHVHMHPHSHQHMHHGPPHHPPHLMHPQAIGHHQPHHQHGPPHHQGHHQSPGHHQGHHSPPSSPLSGGHQMHIHLPMVHLSHSTQHHGGPSHQQGPPPHHQSPHHSPPHSPHHSPPHSPHHSPPHSPTHSPYGSPHHSPPHSPTHPHHAQNGLHF